MLNANLHAPRYPLYTAEQLRERQIQQRVNRLWPSRLSDDPERDAQLLAHRHRIAALMTENGGRDPRCRTVGCEDPYFNQHRVRQYGVHIYRHCPGCDRLCEYQYDAEPGLVNIAPPNNGLMPHMILVPQTGRTPDHVLETTDFHSLQDAQELAAKLDQNLADRHVVDDVTRATVVGVCSRLADNAARHGASDDDAHGSVELQVRQDSAVKAPPSRITFAIVVYDSGPGINATAIMDQLMSHPDIRQPNVHLEIHSGGTRCTKFGYHEPNWFPGKFQQGTMAKATITYWTG